MSMALIKEGYICALSVYIKLVLLDQFLLTCFTMFASVPSFANASETRDSVNTGGVIVTWIRQTLVDFCGERNMRI